MAINKPEIPSIELPEDWGGTQTPYTEQQTQEGYPETIPTVIDGGNLNFEKRGIFKNIKYLRVFSDWLRNMPIGKIPVVNSKGQLDYGQPVLLASDEEYIVGQTIEKSPTVKQVRDSFTDIDGKMTNCITEIPQDIKLELKDGTLTLKGGSKLTDINETRFTTTSDYSIDVGQPTGQRFLFAKRTGNAVGFFVSISANTFSGETQPTPTTATAYWYDTKNKVMKITQDTGKTWSEYSGATFPIASVIFNNGKVTSIDQVFNGFGYIGSTVFALPGVKGLIPNGRNEDGSLKNIEFTVGKVLTKTISSARTNGGLIINESGMDVTNWLGDLENDPISSFTTFTRYYNTVRNVIRSYTSNGWSDVATPFCLYGYYTSNSSNSITSFQPKLPFRAVDQNDLVKKLELNMPAGSILPFAGSTAPSGFLICDGSAISRTTYVGLFKVIGTIYGTGDGSTTFNLPNFVNKTFWGGTSSGTVKSAGLPNITGNFGAAYKGNSGVTGTTDGAFNMDGTFNSKLGSGGASDDWGGQFSFNASRSSSIYGNADTVQPPAVQTLICIKY